MHSKSQTSKLNISKMQESARGRSIVDTSGTSALQLSQSEVNFVNTQPNELYEIVLTVRNVSANTQKVKVKKPDSYSLSLALPRQASLAPGLQMKVAVVFDSKENVAISDRVYIVSDLIQIEVPINVYPQVPKLQFEPFVNMGFAKIGSTVETTWNIKNCGDSSVHIKLVPLLADENASFAVTPKDFWLTSKETQKVNLALTSTQNGTIEGSLEIHPKTLGSCSLDFVANFCEFNRFISDAEGKPLSTVSLDPAFGGQTLKMATYLVNNTPKSCEFRVTRQKGTNGEQGFTLATPEQIGRDDSENLVEFEPSQGDLEAYSSTVLNTSILARYEESDIQLFCNYIMGQTNGGSFEREWSYCLRAYLNHEEEKLDLYLKGVSLVPKIGLSQHYVSFGECQLHSKNRTILRVQNFTERPVSINFENSPNFSFTPSKVKIAENGSVPVNVTFQPKRVGELKQICYMNVGVFSFPIKAIGKGMFNCKSENMHEQGEVEVEHLAKGGLEEQVSAIQQKTTLLENSKTNIHFETHRQQSVKTKGEPFETKKTRILRARNGKEVKLDLNHLNPNQIVEPFPAQARNQQEERIITRELNSLELRNVSVGPVVIEMGTVLLRSALKKTFHICNFNQKPIAIRLEASMECFAETSEERQILPAESHGGFTINFEALTEGYFCHTLQYSLNGNHFFDLQVTGTAIAPVVGLSKQELKFILSEEDKKFEKAEHLKLENTHDYAVNFKWKSIPNSPFVVSPQEGSIPPKSSLTTEVLFDYEGAEPGSKIEETLQLKLRYGRSLDVKCSAMVPECPFSLKINELKFGEMSVGRQYESRVNVKNQSKNPTIYKVQLSKELEGFVSVQPRTGVLAVDEPAQLVFKAISSKPMTLEGSVKVIARGAKTIDLPVKGTFIVPQLRVEEEEIDFGGTPVEGNPAQKEIVLINNSAISVDLELRMHRDTFLEHLLKLGPIKDHNLTLVDTRDTKNYFAYQLRIAAKSKATFVMEFTPEATEEYEFYLPLFLPNVEPLDELQRICRCLGTKNRLTAPQKEVNFGKIVIEQVEQSYNKVQTFEIKNPQEQAISWWVDETALAPFKLQRCKGRLEGFEKTTLKVLFNAEQPGEYKRELRFFIDQTEVDISRCYMHIPVTAVACFPTVYFSVPYLILPTVRPQEQSKAFIDIFNGGYENVNLKHKLSQEVPGVDVIINYPTGSNLGVTKKQIRVEVMFIAEKPVSFTTKIQFYDGNNRTFTLAVSGTADLHCFTLLEHQRSLIGIDKSCQFLKHYLNSCGQLSEDLFEFPDSLPENDYQKLSEFLSTYSMLFDRNKSIRKNYNTFSALEYLSEVIRILKGEGAFLNHIRPELLLSYEDYLESMEVRVEDDPTALTFFKKKDKGAFETERKFAWVVLFYQIFRVFSRVSPGKTKSNQVWAKCLAREKVTTSWLEKSYQSETGLELPCQEQQVLSTLNNGEILSALISKYTNIKILECYGKGARNQKERERRSRIIVETFSQVGINLVFRVEDLLRSNEKEMLLCMQTLHMILPSYLQKGEPIVFACQFGQVITKSVEISNPSKYPITYMAKVEGSKAYSVEGAKQFLIQAKKSHEVKVRFVSNLNTSNSPATLTLTGKASNKFTPSTFVFVMKNNILGRIAEKNVQVTGSLYEQMDFGVKVANNFQEDAEFKVEMVPSAKSTYCGFYMLNSTLKLRRGETANFSMVFLPFTLDAQQVSLIFKDEKVGEFQYDVTGVVESNIMCLETLRIPQTLYTNKKYNIELSVPTRNDLIIRARKASEYLADKLDKRGKDLKGYDKYYPKLTNPSENYSVKLSHPNNSILLRTDSMTIREPESQDENVKRDDQKLTFEINLKAPIREGSFTFHMRNQSATDIRKYKVVLSAVARPLKYELQIKTPANRSLTQPLPLVNVSNERNCYSVTLSVPCETAKGCFILECDRESWVDAHEQKVVPFTFKPKQQGVVNAHLKMENLTTGQHIEYDVIGIGEEPEAELMTFEQEVRKEKNYSIKLPVSKTTRCQVQSFGIEEAQYQKMFIAGPESTYFKFKLLPKMSGKLTGKLIIEADQSLLAYSIEIKVRSSIEGEVKLRTIQRKTVTGEVYLPSGHYRVVNEDRNINIPSEVTVPAGESTVQFSYYSAKREEKQSVLTFISDENGQISFLIKVIVEAMPEIKMQPFQVELGQCHQEPVLFENTDDVPMNIKVKCSHPEVFYAESECFELLPRSNMYQNIIYRPSSLEVEQGKIYFESDRNARWVYHLSGLGLPQSKPQIKNLSVCVGDQICESICFKNPLNKTLQFTVTLDQEEEAFSMLLKSTKMDLSYGQELEIPITVKPKTVAMNVATLKITINDKVSWRYELRARTYFKSTEEPRIFKLNSRHKSEQEVEFYLPHSERHEGESVKLSVRSLEECNEAFLKSVVKVLQGAESKVKQGKVTFTLGMLSFKPKTMPCQLDIRSSKGCKWSYRYDFIFATPTPDDRFEVVSTINKPSSVKFKLNNRLKNHAKFQAYFSSDSSIDFRVIPEQGELEPYGRQGTPIQVIFCPTQYRQNWIGKLIIETEDSYWSYEVKGSLPHYSPPVGKSTLPKN